MTGEKPSQRRRIKELVAAVIHDPLRCENEKDSQRIRIRTLEYALLSVQEELNTFLSAPHREMDSETRELLTEISEATANAIAADPYLQTHFAISAGIEDDDSESPPG